MRLRLLAWLTLILLVSLTACASEVVSPSVPTPQPSQPAPSPSPSHTPSPGPLPPEPALPPTSQQPLNVTLHHFGVRSNQLITGIADIYLLLVITDGYQKAYQRFLPAEGTFSLDSYQSIDISQEVFNTDSAGDSLKVCILAYRQNDPLWRTQILIPALAEIERGLNWGDYRSAQEILTTVDKHMKKTTASFKDGGDTLIGYFEDVWGVNESYGVGDYEGVGSDDLRLWFSIWSTEKPKSPPVPVLLPEITLDDINMVSTTSSGNTRTDIIRVKNAEDHPVIVTLKGSSLLMGDFYGEDIEVPAEGYTWVENNVVNGLPGADTVTYTLFFRDIELDAESEKLKVLADKQQITLVEWRNSDSSDRMSQTLDGTPVTLYVEAPGYTGVTFSASLRRLEPDGSHRYEETIPITIINGLGISQWTAKWQAVLEGDPTYVFGVKDIFSNELTVVQRYEPPPDVSLESVNMPSYVNAGEVRTDTIKIENRESELIVVRLKGYSSIEGGFYNSAVSIPAEDYTTVEIQSSSGAKGIATISYKLYYQGVEFDAWSGLLEVF